MRLLLFIFVAFLTKGLAIDAPLLKMKDNIPGQYIVKIKNDFEVDDVILSLKNSLLEFLGGRIGSRFHALNGFSATLSERALALVRRSRQVAYVEEDALVRIDEVGSWGIDRIDSPDLPMDDEYLPQFDGTGVNIYIIDTGVNPTHNDVIGRAEVFYDAEPIRSNDGIDCHGHGSHCSGTAGGTVYGVAKNANIFGVRVVNCIGFGSTATIIEGMDMVALYASKPAVASMSLGLAVSQATNDAIDSMFYNGVVVSVSAGNDNSDACGQSPASAQNALTVGASDRNDIRASFSNYGPCVDIFAPGVAITSIWMGDPDSTNTISGTSMSCPHVAGAAALVLGENPEFSPAEVTAALLNTAANDKVADIKDTPYNKLLQVKSL
ncbi:aqualysin-1-like [Apostichopus japonicus]|uniref:aqualysin-1-like n=1 Tax=Stichopus japonicus TaxID=307972 RepID=UPI003AB8EE92